MLLLHLVGLPASPGFTQVNGKADKAASIERECGLKKGTITVSGGEIRLRPSPDEAHERVDCALEKLITAGDGKIGFVGNEADPTAILPSPLRWVAVGSEAQIAALRKAAEADRWVIVRTAAGSDGTALLQFESGPNMTHGKTGLVERIWKQEFGDLEFGYSPTKLSAPSPYDK